MYNYVLIRNQTITVNIGTSACCGTTTTAEIKMGSCQLLTVTSDTVLITEEKVTPNPSCYMIHNQQSPLLGVLLHAPF